MERVLCPSISSIVVLKVDYGFWEKNGCTILHVWWGFMVVISHIKNCAWIIPKILSSEHGFITKYGMRKFNLSSVKEKLIIGKKEIVGVACIWV